MRVTIPTTGSRGDVQPYIALGKGLQRRGHRVCLATHDDFEALVRGNGLDFFPLTSDSRTLQASETGERMLRAGDRPFEFLREFVRLRRPLIHSMMENCLQACRDADVVLLTNTELLIGQSVAEKLKLPAIWSSLQPVAPTRYQVNSLFPPSPTWLPSGVYNLATHLLTGETMWQLQRREVNAARHAVLGLPPIWFLGPLKPFLFPPLYLDGYSKHVVPRPPDWNRKHHITGYWFLDADPSWRPPARLRDFLTAGPPPVYVGFGSMHNRDAGRVTRLIVSALGRARQRGIIFTGWGGLERVPQSDRLFALDAPVPHDWLFPFMAAVVHHGGAGTTAAALRAGVPAVVVPFMSDQPFWARRVNELGAGPPAVPRADLSVERLAEGIRRAVTNPTYRRKAARLGSAIRAEDGVARAAELFDDYVRTLNSKTERTRLRGAGGSPA